MTDYGKYKLSFNDAKNEVAGYDNMADAEFMNQVSRWATFNVPEQKSVYREIRNEVVAVFQKSLADHNNKITYDLDLSVGLKLYELLSSENGFNIISASDDDIWRYISLRVIPDLTFIRYPNRQDDVNIISECIKGLSYANRALVPEKDSIRLRRKRFYSHTRRIWAKTLWWYIHLGWQGNTEKTYAVLRNNGTNVISHLIERPGRGYRENLFRNMLYAYSSLPAQKDVTFRAAAKLNLAKCISLEPSLAEGGERRYSERLFAEVYKNGTGDSNAEEDDLE